MVSVSGALFRRKRRLGVRTSPFLRSPIDRVANRRLCWQTVLRTGKVKENAEPLTEYENDPVGFCADILGITAWSSQVEIMEAVRDNPRVSVAACYASGKTFVAACLVLWWIYTRRPAMVVSTAPTGRQVRTLLWREIRKLYKRARRNLPGRLLQTRLELDDDWFGMGFASDAQNSVAGLHEAANVLFLEDEAAGMTEEVVEGFEGITATEGSRHLKIGNPICQSGPFFDSHMHPEESQRWVKISIDAEDTPNVKAGKTVVPGLVSREWVDDKKVRWLGRGLKHLWETKVKGHFFVTAKEKLIPQDWIIEAQKRWATADTEGIDGLGSDIAGGGRDSTEHAHRTGQRVEVETGIHTDDLMLQARDIVRRCIEKSVGSVAIDRTGLGQGVWSRVVELQADGVLPAEIEVIGVALNKAPEDKETFATRQDEIMWSLRDALDPNGSTLLAIDPSDKELAEQLALREWTTNPKGQVSVESKIALKRRGKRSPDKADAVSLTTVPPKAALWWG